MEPESPKEESKDSSPIYFNSSSSSLPFRVTEKFATNSNIESMEAAKIFFTDKSKEIEDQNDERFSSPKMLCKKIE